ncbi:MAG: nucleoside hydrolase [Clostridia bacterium]
MEEKGLRRMVLDTDTYNEVDDQFALVYALLSEEVKLEAVYAAPFHNERSSSPGDGMHRSHEEILRLLDLMGCTGDGFVFKGSDRYMGSLSTPCRNAAVEDLIKKAGKSNPADPLYVVAIGAPTNVASAITLEPGIMENIIVVWLGGNARCWPRQNEFNQKQDLVASRVLFDSKVRLVQIPCWPVASHLKVSVPELKACMGDSRIAHDLVGIVDEALHGNLWQTRVIWDISAVAYVVNPRFMRIHSIHSPVLCEDMVYALDETRHWIDCAYYVDRDGIFGDFYKKIHKLPQVV